ncbi:MAG: type II secretion system F family protein [Bryobacterales bacterium]|nr:type II secretion system F family protein [Acidobacteriota bacterium]MCB9384854.1 type II secretion system F family protein [Bryobacterales bacterium]
MLLGLSIGVFAMVLAAVAAGGYWFYIREPRTALASAGGGAASPAALDDDAPEWASTLQHLAGAAPFRAQAKPGMREELAAAGIRAQWAPAAFQSAKVVAALAVPVVVFFLLWGLGGDWAAALPGTALSSYLGYTLPERWLRRRVRSRRQAVNRALPDFLDLLVIAIESGLSLDQALADTARDLRKVHPVLSDELSVFRSELLAGASRSEALKNLGARVGEPELRKLTALLIQADRFGSSVSKMLRTQARYMRIRRRQLAEEKAHKVGVKLLFPIFLLIMPSVFLVTAGPAVLMLVTNFGKIAGDL